MATSRQKRHEAAGKFECVYNRVGSIGFSSPMLKHALFQTFRRIAGKFSGRRLRSRYPFLNTLYARLNQRLAPTRAQVLGQSMILDPGDSMGLALRGIYEPIETEFILKTVRPGQAVLDIGANIGYYTLIFARLVEKRGKVYCFEPDPASFQLLRQNISHNGYKNVTLENKAVSDKTGETFLQRDRFNNLDHRISAGPGALDSMAIEAVCLDDYFRGSGMSFDFIKMDIQGAEGLALQGMKGLLARSKSVKILMEFWPFGLENAGTDPVSLLEEIEHLGFSILDIGSTPGTEPVKRTKAELLEMYPADSAAYANLFCVRMGES